MNFLRGVSEQITSTAISFSLPYGLNDLAQIRMDILEEMKAKGFDHYLGQMKEISAEIDRVLLSETSLEDDFYWSNTFFQVPYWQVESPWLKRKHWWKRLKRANLFEPGGVTTATSALLKPSFVQDLIGDPYWMTIQQKLVFRTLISTYFSNDVRLWPINLNMDFVYRKLLIRVAEEEKKGQITGSRLSDVEIERRVNAWQPPDITLKPPEISEEEWLVMQAEMRAKYKKQLLEYNDMPVAQRRKVTTFEKVLKAALAGSGPFILKVLQQINTANENKVDGELAVAELTKDIFSNIPGLTTQEAQFVRAGFNIPDTYVENMNPQTLGSASIAEAHVTRNDDLGIDAVLKFIKPMYAYYFLCESDFILTTAWRMLGQQVERAVMEIEDVEERERRYKILLRQTRKLLMFFVKEFIKEFDYKQEWVNTVIGYEEYDQEYGRIKSIIPMAVGVNPFPVLVLQLVRGVNVDKLINSPTTTHQEFVVLYRTIYSLINLWFQVTLWGSGFFHADLHPGNVMVTEQGVLYLIDFGSCGTLTEAQQCQIIDAMVLSNDFWALEPGQEHTVEGAEKHRHNLEVAEKFVKKIWNMCGVPQYTQSHLREVSRKIVDYEKGIYFSTLFLDIVEVSDDIGACSTNDLLMFGRGVAYLGNMIIKITERCNDVGECPEFLVNAVIKSNLIKHPKQLWNLQFSKTVCPRTPV